MRDPRFRFGDDVRAATKEMSGRMAERGSAPQNGDELEWWITANPDIHQRLAQGGYGKEFNAEDLLPLLHVFLAQRQPAPAAVRHPTAAFSWPLVAGLLLLLVLLVWAAMAGNRGL
jgi:hypothetical protein